MSQSMISRFLLRTYHLIGTFTPHMFVSLGILFLNWVMPSATILALLIVVTLVECSLCIMIIQFALFRSKEWKQRPLALQALYASKRLSLADHSPAEWCWHMLRDNKASFFQYAYVLSVLPLIVSVTGLRQAWFRFKRLYKHNPGLWSYYEYILDQKDHRYHP